MCKQQLVLYAPTPTSMNNRSASRFQLMLTGVLIGLTACPPNLVYGTTATGSRPVLAYEHTLPETRADRERDFVETPVAAPLAAPVSANSPPTLSAVSNRTINVGQRLSVRLSAVDLICPRHFSSLSSNTPPMQPSELRAAQTQLSHGLPSERLPTPPISSPSWSRITAPQPSAPPNHFRLSSLTLSSQTSAR